MSRLKGVKVGYGYPPVPAETSQHELSCVVEIEAHLTEFDELSFFKSSVKELPFPNCEIGPTCPASSVQALSENADATPLPLFVVPQTALGCRVSDGVGKGSLRGVWIPCGPWAPHFCG